MNPILGIAADSEIPFIDHEGKFYSEGDVEPSTYITFQNAGTSARRDIVEVKADEITAVEQSRQFYDPETESSSYSQTDIEKRTILRLKVKKGTNGSNTAPAVDTGYVKIAEVLIPANATSVSNTNIFNVSADIEGIDNSGWTADKQVTINPGTLKEISTKFRAIHNSDGSLKDTVISAAKLILSGTGALKGDAIQKGGSAEEIDGESVPATSTISAFFAKIAAKLRKVADKPTKITQAEYDKLTSAQRAGRYWIITDAIGSEQPLIKDSVKALDSVWSSKKVSDLLASLSDLTLLSGTDINLCIPSAENKTEVFYLTSSALNLPAPHYFHVIATRNRHSSSSNRLSQFAIATSVNQVWFRYGTRNSTDGSVTWQSWSRLSTATELNSAISDKVTETQLNNALAPYLPTETGTNPTSKYNDDLNNILTEGRYSISGARWDNYPDTTQTLMLSVFDSKNWVGQIAISANYTFTRRYSKDNKTWSAWQKIINYELLNKVIINLGLRTDANTAESIPTESGVSLKYFRATENVPISGYGWFIESKITKDGTSVLGSQMATRNGGAPLIYIRSVSLSNGALTYGKWRKVTIDES